MEERVIQFRVGVMVVATIILGAILVLLFSDVSFLNEQTYEVKIAFPSAPGVAQDTPVRKSGILVGRVRGVELVDGEGVLITAAIQSKYRLRRNEVCQISGSLLGDAVLQFVQVQNRPGAQPGAVVQPGERLQGIVASDPLQSIGNLEGDLGTAIRSVARTSEEINVLVRRLNTVLETNDSQIGRVVDKAERTLDEIRDAAKNANEIVSDPALQDDLRRAIKDMPDALAEVRQAVAGMQRTMATADRNLQNIEGLTKPLGERGDEVIRNVERATARIDELFLELGDFTRTLNDSRGSLNRIIEDPELYENLNEAVVNINELSRDLKPIMKDVRAFTDKAARHPEKLGIRGLISPSSGIK